MTAPPTARPRPQPIHVVGAALAVGAAALLLIAYTALDWYDQRLLTSVTGSSSLPDVHDLLSLVQRTHWIAEAFFGWAAWVLLVLGVGAAILGNIAAAAAHPARGPGLVAVLIGLLGVAATFGAVDLYPTTGRGGGSYSEWITHVGPAFFCAVAGFLLIAFSGAAAARRPVPRNDEPRDTDQPTPDDTPAADQPDSAAS